MNPEQHCYHKYTPPPFAGEDLKVVASIENSSSREIKPKYTLYQKVSFFARGKRRVSTKDILKELGEPIPPSGKLKVTKVLKIPQHIVPSIFTCSNIKCEYRLKVCVSVSLSLCLSEATTTMCFDRLFTKIQKKDTGHMFWAYNML